LKNDPLERTYGVYRITLRKNDHIAGRPTPHVEVWKKSRKLGNYDMASGKIIFKSDLNVPKAIKNAIADYLKDPQVIKKIESMIRESYFDLSKPAGQYGGIPRGFRASILVEYTADSLGRYNQ